MLTTRLSLLAEAQRRQAAGASQEEIIEWVCGVAGHYGIRVRSDKHAPHRIPAALARRAVDAKSAPGAPATEVDTGPVAGPALEPVAAPVPAPEPVAEPVPVPAPAPEPVAEPVAAPVPEPVAEPEAKKRAGRRARRARKAARSLPVTITRQRDGTHCLTFGATATEPELELEPEPEPAPAPAPGAQDEMVTVARLVLSTDRHGSARGRGAPLYYECNGLVVDARTWRALAVPPRAFNHRPSPKAVDAHLAEGRYDLTRVDDGTVVTLYCWAHPLEGEIWALASSNGYDVSSLRWTGARTYAEVIYDLARRLYPEFCERAGASLVSEGGATRLAFERLDPTRCYTVGFRHHDFHPMASDPERMWQIQSAALDGGAPRLEFGPEGGLPGIPAQTFLDAGAVGAGALLTLESLRALGRDAFSRLAAGHAAGHAPDYGFILRSRAPELTAGHSDILVETPLLARVRRLAYERAPRSVRDSLTPADRLEYNAMRSFLTATERADFLVLFPDWAPRYRAYGEFVDNVVRHVVHALRLRSMAPASREPAPRSATGQVARALVDHICRYEKLTAFHQDTESIVRDYVVNPEYALLYLRAARVR